MGGCTAVTSEWLNKTLELLSMLYPHVYLGYNEYSVFHAFPVYLVYHEYLVFTQIFFPVLFYLGSYTSALLTFFL